VLKCVSNKLKFRKARRKKEEKPNRIKFFCCGGILGSLLRILACTSPFSIPALSYSLYTRWNVETLFFQPELGPRLTANRAFGIISTSLLDLTLPEIMQSSNIDNTTTQSTTFTNNLPGLNLSGAYRNYCSSILGVSWLFKHFGWWGF
jgi:hypothetical protein